MIIKYVNDTCALLFMFRGDGYSIIYLRSVSLQKQSALCGCCTQCRHDVIFSVVCFSNWFPLASTCSHPSSRAPSLMSRHWPCVTWPRHISWHIVTCVARLPPCQPVCRTIGEWNIFSSEWNIFQQIAGTEGNHRSDCQGEVNNLSALGLWSNFGHRTQGWGEEWSRRIILTSSLPQYGWCYKYGIIASCSRYKIYDVLSDGNHHKKYCTHTGGQQPGPGPGQETNGVLLKRGLFSWGWPVLAS